MKKVAFTIVSKNYLGQAITSKNYFDRVNSCGYEYQIFLMDLLSSAKERKLIESLRERGYKIHIWTEVISSFPSFDFASMIERYDVMEMNTAIKPFILAHLLKSGAERAVYFDPDIAFYSSFEELDSLLNKNDVLLTPHCLEPFPDDERNPRNITLNKAGIYNLGFIALKRSDNSLKLCDFWQSCLFDKAYNKPEQGMFTDQKWADFFPSLFSNVNIVKNKGFNVAYWNLHEREPILREKTYWVGKDKLFFLHFSGLFFENINLISKYQDRFVLTDFGVDLINLFKDYRDNLERCGYKEYKKLPYYYKDTVASNYVKRRNEGSSLIKSAKILRNYFRSKHPRMFLNFKRALTCVYPNWRKDLKEIKNKVDNNKIEEERNKRFEASPVIHLYTYYNEPHSISRAGEGFLEGLSSTGIPSILTDICRKFDNLQVSGIKKFDLRNELSIFVINLDQVPVVVPKFTRNESLKFAYCFWEYSSGLEKFEKAFEYIDGVFVATDFVYNAVKKIAPKDKKIFKLPLPFIIDFSEAPQEQIIKQRNKLNLKKEDFAFFFNFDYSSSYDRKNPLSILKALKIVLSSNKNAKVVFKTSNSELHSCQYKDLVLAIKALNLQEHVVIIDKFLTRQEFVTLLSGMDAYISLHRGEGLGLGMMEAMYLSIPVIATNYSGNTDFCTESTAALVNYSIVPCNDKHPAYSLVREWAEPDIEDAAAKMIKVMEGGESIKGMIKNAKEFVTNNYSKEKYCKRLNEILTVLAREQKNTSHES